MCACCRHERTSTSRNQTSVRTPSSRTSVPSPFLGVSEPTPGSRSTRQRLDGPTGPAIVVAGETGIIHHRIYNANLVGANTSASSWGRTSCPALARVRPTRSRATPTRPHHGTTGGTIGALGNKRTGITGVIGRHRDGSEFWMRPARTIADEINAIDFASDEGDFPPRCR